MADRSSEPRDDPAVLFGPYRLEIGDASLWNGTHSVPLTPKAFSVLQCLAQRPADFAHAHFQHSVADEHARPHRLDQFLFGHQPARPLRQTLQY